MFLSHTVTALPVDQSVAIETGVKFRCHCWIFSFLFESLLIIEQGKMQCLVLIVCLFACTYGQSRSPPGLSNVMSYGGPSPSGGEASSSGNNQPALRMLLQGGGSSSAAAMMGMPPGMSSGMPSGMPPGMASAMAGMMSSGMPGMSGSGMAGMAGAGMAGAGMSGLGSLFGAGSGSGTGGSSQMGGLFSSLLGSGGGGALTMLAAQSGNNGLGRIVRMRVMSKIMGRCNLEPAEMGMAMGGTFGTYALYTN